MGWHTDWKTYIRNLTVMILRAVVTLLMHLVLLPAYLIRWIAEHMMWLVMGAVGVAVIAAWFWRCITEPMG